MASGLWGVLALLYQVKDDGICPITSCQIGGETMETMTDFISGAPKSLQMVTAAMKLKDCCLEENLEEKL